MAGDWIKMECNLPDKPEVLAITAAMGWDDPDLTVGKLMRLFRWFDQQTTDGNAVGVTASLLDRVVGATGFVQAMQNVGWMIVSDAGLSLKNFNRHNGSTAKTRAQTAKRVASHRASEPCNAESNAPTVTPALAREEKRREERKPIAPPAGFAEFWSSWPKNDRKGGRAECLSVWSKLGLERESVAIVAHVKAMSATDGWRKQGGAFIPAPVVYLRGRRWDGSELELGSRVGDPLFDGVL